MNKNQQLIHHIVHKIGVHDMGGMFDGSSSEMPLNALVDLAHAELVNSIMTSPPELCNICGCAFNEEKYLIDGAVKKNGSWAFMCPDCFSQYGKGIGWGIGQLYLKRSSDWLMVAGFSPD